MSFISCFQIGNYIFAGSNPVCICPFDDNIDVKMLDVGIIIQTKANIGLVICTMFAVIVCCLLVTPVFLVTQAVAPSCSLKKGSPINSAKPTLSGKILRQSLSSNNEESPAHMFSPGFLQNPQEHFSHITPPWAASVVIYTLKMTELLPGVDRKMII